MSADDFIFFEDVPEEATGRKTRIVEVKSRRTGEALATIKWYGPWRQYCFYPLGETIWNPVCLGKVTDQILAMMNERRRR